jgi:prepilin-type N-terminal cleavage/methylation domain-containing protein
MRKGFTLVEVVVAMAIILFVAVACIQVMGSNSRASLSTLKRIQAAQYLDQIHNHLLRSNVAKLDDHYRKFPQIITTDDYSAEAVLQPTAADGSRRAAITIRWTFGRSENSISEEVTLASR